MLKTRTALLIEGDEKEVAERMHELIAGEWEAWNHVEEYDSGGHYAVLVLSEDK